MKTFNKFFAAALALFLVTACSNDSSVPEPVIGDGMTEVVFDIDATEVALGVEAGTRTFTPTYSAAGFAIRAFRKNTSNNKYEYAQSVDVSKLTYTTATKKLTGTVILPVGSYKFLITYGAGQSQLTFPTYAVGTELTEAALITCAYTNGGTGLGSELFLQTDRQTPSTMNIYDFKVSGETPNPTVSETLKRAVSRIDVLFVSATKSGSVYNEKAFGSTTRDILDNRDLKLGFSIDKLATTMSLVGAPGTTPVQSNVTVAMDYTASANANKVTIGTGGSTSTVGTSGYLTYDNVLPAHISTKGAHAFGTYFFPFAGADKTDLTLTITGQHKTVPSDVVIRTVAVPNVPLEPNKVTLIKIYVVDGGGDPTNPPSVFDTNVTFNVELVTDWLGTNTVEVEVN